MRCWDCELPSTSPEVGNAWAAQRPRWRALRGDAKLREQCELSSAVVQAAVAEGEVVEQIEGPVACAGGGRRVVVASAYLQGVWGGGLGALGIFLVLSTRSGSFA